DELDLGRIRQEYAQAGHHALGRVRGRCERLAGERPIIGASGHDEVGEGTADVHGHAVAVQWSVPTQRRLPPTALNATASTMIIPATSTRRTGWAFRRLKPS